MNVVSRHTLLKYEKEYPNAGEALRTWYHVVKQAKWERFEDLRTYYPRTDYIGNDRYVFDLKGNSYRLIVIIRFNSQVVYIRWFGTHAKYDKLKDASTV